MLHARASQPLLSAIASARSTRPAPLALPLYRPRRPLSGDGRRATSTFRSRIGALRSNGTPEIVFGLTLLGLLAADRFLQDRQRHDRDAVLRQLQVEVDGDVAESRRDGTALSAEEEESRPAIFRCRVRSLPKLFDGTKSLRGVAIGDVIEVLEESIGPGGTYNLCRFVAAADTDGGKGRRREESVHVGWFPMACLEKLEQ